jgi:membrane protein
VNPGRRWTAARLGTEGRAVLAGSRRLLRGRDLALIAAGLTFYAGIAVVPLLLVAVRLTALVTSPAEVRTLVGRLTELLPAELGAPGAVERLAAAGVRLDLLGFVLALVPLSFYGEGLRRALLRFSQQRDRDTLTGWRGRLLTLPLVVLTPVLLYPLLLAARFMADLALEDGLGPAVGRFFVGYYAVLFVLTVPLAWGFGVVAAGRHRRRAVASGALFTAACLSGFLQGFVIFLALPLDLGAPFGGLVAVGAVVAVGLWMFLLHLVLLAGWLLTQSLDERLGRRQWGDYAGGQPGTVGQAGAVGGSGAGTGSGTGAGAGTGSGAGGGSGAGASGSGGGSGAGASGSGSGRGRGAGAAGGSGAGST